MLSNQVNSGQQGTWNSSTGHPDSNTIHFGVRDTSLATYFQTAFTLQLTPSPFTAYGSGVITSVDNNLFNGGSSNPAVNVPDDGYFTLTLNGSVPATWKPILTYNFEYNPFAGMATNLAGRLFHDRSITPGSTLDRNPPYITLTLAGNNDRKVYVQFSRPVVALPQGPTPDMANLTGVFLLSGTSNSNSIVSMQLINPTGVATATTSQTFQEALLTLAKPLAAADLTTATLQAILYAGHSTVSGSNNDMLTTVVYPISFLGIDLVQPVWATDGSGGELNQTGTSHVIHDFTGLQPLAPRDITLQAKVFGGAANNGLPLQLFYDVNATSSLVTNGIWLPNGIFQPTGVVAKVPPNSDTASRSIAPSSSDAAGDLKTFVIPGADAQLNSGKQVQFIFRIGSLYAVRGTNQSDPRQLGLYQFPLQAITTQKNGVTILHNVIDPTQGQQTEILYTMKKAGVVTVEVFALDGSAVQVLHRGRQAPGDYSVSWDGKNAGGHIVARGIYFVRVVAPDTDETRNIMVIK